VFEQGDKEELLRDRVPKEQLTAAQEDNARMEAQTQLDRASGEAREREREAAHATAVGELSTQMTQACFPCSIACLAPLLACLPCSTFVLSAPRSPCFEAASLA
jgi:hypothetical protein